MRWLSRPNRRARTRRNTTALSAGALRFEPLEIRRMLSAGGEEEQGGGIESGGGTVTDDPNAENIVLIHDTIPNFAQNPTHTSVASGNWFNPGIWSTGTVPGAGAIVQITDGTTVTYNGISNAAIEAVGVNPGGKLEFDTTIDTRLTVTHLIVFEGGHLQIGTQANPVPVSVTAEIVIADMPLDFNRDPAQYGNGFISVGKVEIYGAAKTFTWHRLLTQPKAGDTTLSFWPNVPAGWRVGETVILPDTTQVAGVDATLVNTNQPGAPPPQWEEAVITGISGNQVTLASPLQFNHFGASNENGAVEFSPHAAVLDRNVIIRSENAEGTRGHVFFGHRADIDINYARFQDLGRTEALVPLDNTTFDSEGNPTHIGTNQIARYTAHFHHLMGPVNPTNTGYQFRFVGNTLDGGKKWGMAVHDTSWGLIKDNVAYDFHGAAFVTEDGSEIGNEFFRNYAMRIQGTGIDGEAGTEIGDYGRGGVGFWSRRTGNVFQDNAVANATYAGFVTTSKFVPTVVIPLARGFDKTQPGQGQLINGSDPGTYLRNEIYGRTRFGMWYSWPSNYNIDHVEGTLEIENAAIWHTHSRAISFDFSSDVTIDKARILAKPSLLASEDPQRPTVGVGAKDHTNRNLLITDSRIYGMKFGVETPPEDLGGLPGGNPTVVRDTFLQNYVNVHVSTLHSTDAKGLDLINVEFAQLPIAPLPDQPARDIFLDLDQSSGNLVGSDVVRLLDIGGDPLSDVRLYYPEQHPDYIVPESSPGVTAAPVAGLTNLELWQQHGLAIGGAIAPCTDALCTNAVQELLTNAHAFPLMVTGDISGPAQITRGNQHTFTLTATDVSLFEQPDFTFHIDWDGDGSADETVVGPSGSQVTHTFFEGGTFDVQMWAESPLGETSGLNTHTVDVLNYELVPNAEQPALLDLIWYGSSGNDLVYFWPNPGGVLVIEQLINGVFTNNLYSVLGATGDVVAQLGDGDDSFAMAFSDRRAIVIGGPGNEVIVTAEGDDFIDGGPGGDVIIAGGGNDIIVGGDDGDLLIGGDGDDALLGQGGNDTLRGENGRDLLAGGAGRDTFEGDAGEDLLIAGLATFADDPLGVDFLALDAIGAEWLSSRSYAERVANLSGTGVGPRANGDTFLIPGSTVFFDDEGETLVGGSELDWVLASFSSVLYEGQPIPIDVFDDEEPGEISTDTPDAAPWW